MSRATVFFAVLFVSILAMLTLPLSAQESKPLPAKTVLDAAMKKAKAERKTVFVIFHASWCGWCRRLDDFLKQPEIQKTVNAHYVVVHLDVLEPDAKKALENPGADQVLESLGGAKAGLPFYAFLDAKGKKLADANALPKGQNIGYPAAPEEIAAFAELLKKTAPKMNSADREKLVAALKKNAPQN